MTRVAFVLCGIQPNKPINRLRQDHWLQGFVIGVLPSSKSLAKTCKSASDELRFASESAESKMKIFAPFLATALAAAPLAASSAPATAGDPNNWNDVVAGRVAAGAKTTQGVPGGRELLHLHHHVPR
jgi:hypothetical protein